MIPNYATQEAALTVYCFYVRENPIKVGLHVIKVH